MSYPEVGSVTVHYFEGPAGSGKTTALMAELNRLLNETPISQNERILALTFMHGSRKRLNQRLRAILSLKGLYDCRTIDSFAWQLYNRWRSLATKISEGIMVQCEEDYDGVCELAARLVTYREVSHWVARTYPIIVVDEMQDCRGGRLSLLQHLSEVTILLAAADEFQDLKDIEANVAVGWLRTNGITVSLQGNHRTSTHGLLGAAEQLRTGQSITRGRGMYFLTAFSSPMAASIIATQIEYWGRRNIAILTPTTPERSNFVSQIVERLRTNTIKPRKLNREVGPYLIEWEFTSAAEEERLASEIGIPFNSTTDSVDVSSLDFTANYKGISIMRYWLDNQRRLTGRTQFTTDELRSQVRRTIQQLKSFGRSNDHGIKAMTIHQAKNREFNSVIVLWPYQVTNCPESQRRLLYNAITRAKNQALVIVQDNKGDGRLNQPPFNANKQDTV